MEVDKRVIWQWRNRKNIMSARRSRSMSIGISHVDRVQPWDDALKKMYWEWHFTSVVLFPKPHSPVLSWEKNMKQTPVEGPSTNNLTITPQTYQFSKTRKIQETITAEKSQRRHDKMQCVAWMGSWNTKEILGKN